MSPLVSVVIPAYNNAAHIEATVRSVLAQTLDDFELIISDHASTDRTLALVRPFLADKRVRVESISAGGGAGRNWNHVSSLARGKYLKLVCGDDLLSEESLERQVRAFAAHGLGVAFVAAQRDIIDASGHRVLGARGLAGLSGRVDGRHAARVAVRNGTNVFGEPCCVLFNRTALVDVGYWEDANGYVIDLATYLKILRVGDVVAMPESLASFRVSAGQWSLRLKDEQERQVHGLRRDVRREWAGVLSTRDLVQGALMTKFHAWERRAAYRVLRRRMTTQ